MSTTPPVSRAVPAPTPLSPDQIAEIERGRRRARKVRRAAGVAALSGWTLAGFSLMSLAFALAGDWVSVAAGVVLAAVAFNEFKGGERLKKFDEGGARQLARGQLVLGVAIALYAAWNAYAATRAPATSSVSTSSAEVNQMYRDIMGEFGPMVRAASIMVWAVVGGGGLLACWLTAWYYSSRRKVVRQLRERTPAWVVEVLRRAG